MKRCLGIAEAPAKSRTRPSDHDTPNWRPHPIDTAAEVTLRDPNQVP